MANTSTSTPNYDLPQWAGSDLTDWMELNPAFETIDTALTANKNTAHTAQQSADTNTQSIANLTQNMNNTITRVTTLENKSNSQGQQITLNTTHLNEHDVAITNLNQSVNALSNTPTQIAGLQTNVTALQQQMTAANANIATNADTIGNITPLKSYFPSDRNNNISVIIEQQLKNLNFIPLGTPNHDYVAMSKQYLSQEDDWSNPEFVLNNMGGNVYIAHALLTFGADDLLDYAPIYISNNPYLPKYQKFLSCVGEMKLNYKINNDSGHIVEVPLDYADMFWLDSNGESTETWTQTDQVEITIYTKPLYLTGSNITVNSSACTIYQSESYIEIPFYVPQ